MNEAINLIHGDCLEEMKRIPDKSVQLILCDLPYGTTKNKSLQRVSDRFYNSEQERNIS